MFTDDAAGVHLAFEDVLPKEQLQREKKLEICQDYQHGRCRAGESCPMRHVISSFKTVQTKVCKHWLRGACVNGENCLYLHEYDDRFVPPCAFYDRLGECSNPECPFQHVRAAEQLPECAAYRRGFCPQGPECRLRHVRQDAACPFYLAGFCPLGARCAMGHPVQELHNRTAVTKRILDRMLVERADDPTFNRTAVCYRPGCFDPGHLAPHCPGPHHSVLRKIMSQVQEPGEPLNFVDSGGGGGGLRGARQRCFLCNQEGHMVRDCPMNTGKSNRGGGGGGFRRRRDNIDGYRRHQ